MVGIYLFNAMETLNKVKSKKGIMKTERLNTQKRRAKPNWMHEGKFRVYDEVKGKD